MKNFNPILLNSIKTSRDFNSEQREELLNFIAFYIRNASIIKCLHAHVFHTRLLSSDEFEINQPLLIKSLLGYNDNELPLFDFSKFFKHIHKDDADDFRAMMQELYHRKCDSYTGIFRMLNKNGDYIWLLGKAFYVADDEMSAKPIIAGILVEISNKFRTQRQLSLMHKKMLLKKSKEFCDKFSPLEISVVRLLANGLTGEMIGIKLNISESYVERIKNQMFLKASAHNSAQLVKIFCDSGIL